VTSKEDLCSKGHPGSVSIIATIDVALMNICRNTLESPPFGEEEVKDLRKQTFTSRLTLVTSVERDVLELVRNDMSRLRELLST
jgi:hypothetical protein